MNPNLLILTVGLSYIVVFGAMSVLKREGLSTQFALEGLAVTALVVVGGLLSGSAVNPILFLVFIYVVTMRARLLVDVAILLSQRGRQRDAINVLQMALSTFPDRTARLIILTNMGIVQLRRQNPQSAEQLFETVLEEARQGGLGIQHQAACHYNLGLALRRQGKEIEAVQEFNNAINTFPNSMYSKEAARALQERRRGKAGSGASPDDIQPM